MKLVDEIRALAVRVGQQFKAVREGGGANLVGYEAGTVATELYGRVNFRRFGPSGEGAIDDTGSLMDFLNYLQSNGGQGFIGDGVYKIDPISLSLVRDLDIVLSGNARFEYYSPSAEPLFKFVCAQRGAFGLKWTGGTLDNSGGLYVPAAQSNTCLDLIRLRNASIFGVSFLGAENYDVANGTTDSGITPTDCKNLTVQACYFRGMGDVGIYTTGGGDPGPDDDGGNHVYVGNHFYECHQGLSVKRQQPRTIVNANTFENCYAGVTALEADSSSETIGPGRQLIVSANTFKKIESTAVSLRIEPGSIITDNIIEDFGRARDGSLHVFSQAVRLLGNSDCVVTGNSVSLKDWVDDPQMMAFFVTAFRDNSDIVHTPSRNLFQANSVRNLRNGFVENTANGGTGRNFYFDNSMSGVAVEYAINNALSLSRRLHQTQGYSTNFVGSTEIIRVSADGVYGTRFRSYQDPQGITRIQQVKPTLNFGSVEAGSTKDIAVPLVGCTTNHNATITAGATQFPAGISYVCRATADQVIVRAVNVTGSAITLPEAQYIINAIQVT